MDKCKNCGFKSHSKFCPNCGEPMKVKTYLNSLKGKKKICWYCSKSFKESDYKKGSRFCTNCGADLKISMKDLGLIKLITKSSGNKEYEAVLSSYQSKDLKAFYQAVKTRRVKL